MEGVTEIYRQNHKVLEVDIKKVSYQGLLWHQLGALGKRKLDNVIFLRHARDIGRITERIIIRYV